MKWISDTPVKVDGKNLPWARAWYHMKRRCYSPKFHARNPTYIGCQVCEEWHTGSVFKAWYDVNYIKGYQLDKDFLGDGKLYSPATCCYVPQWLNNLLTDHRNARGDLPQGVSRNRNGYQAQLKVDGKKTCLGTYNTPEAAFHVYAKAKFEYVWSKQADIYSLRNGFEIWDGVLRIMEQQLNFGPLEWLVSEAQEMGMYD